jgi:hypothetical protein
MNISGEGPFINNKTNWLAIQRQLSHLERQQTSLMNMLQVSLSLFLECSKFHFLFAAKKKESGSGYHTLIS